MNPLTLFLLSCVTYRQCLSNVDATEMAKTDILLGPCQGLAAAEPVIHYWYLKLNMSTADGNFNLSQDHKYTELTKNDMYGARSQLQRIARDALRYLVFLIQSKVTYRYGSSASRHEDVAEVSGKFVTIQKFLTELLEVLPVDKVGAMTAISGIQNQTAKSLESLDQVMGIGDSPDSDEDSKVALLTLLSDAYKDVRNKYPTPYTPKGWWQPLDITETALNKKYEDTMADIKVLCAHHLAATATPTKATTTTTSTTPETTTTTSTTTKLSTTTQKTTTAPLTDPTTEVATTVTDATELPTTSAQQQSSTTSSSPELSKLFIEVALFCGMVYLAFCRFI